MNCENCVIWKKYFEGDQCIIAEENNRHNIETVDCPFNHFNTSTSSDTETPL